MNQHKRGLPKPACKPEDCRVGKRGESRYREIFNRADDGIVFHERMGPDANGYFQEVNPALCRLLGYSPEEMQHLTPLDIISPEDRKAVKEDIQILERDGVLRHEKTLLGRDGRRIPVEIVTRQFEKDGRLMIMSVIRDITSRKQAEETLRHSQQMLKGAESLSHTGAWEWDLLKDEWTVSDEWMAIHGCESRILTMEELLTIIFPSDRKGFVQAMDALRDGSDLLDIEHRILRPGDKQVRFIHKRGRCLRDDAGHVIKVYGFAQDITSRKKAEEKLRENDQRLQWALQGAGGAWEWNLVTGDTWWSPEMYDLWGISPETPVRMDNSIDYLYEEDRQRVRRAIGESINECRDFQCEFRIRHTDRGERWIDSRGRLVYDATGQTLRLIGLMQDVTERKKAEEILRESEARLRSLVDNLPFEVWAINAEGVCTVQNPASRAAWGDCLGTRPEETVRDAAGEVAAHWEDLRRRAFAGEIVRDEITYNRHGLLRTYQEIVAPVRLGEEIHSILGVNIDITDRKLVEEQLRHFNETLEQRVSDRTSQVQEKADQLRALAIQLSQAEQVERKRLAQILHDHIQQLIVAARMQLGWMKRGDLNQVQSTAAEVDAVLGEALDASRSLAVDLSPPVLHEAGLIGGLNWLASDLWKKHRFRVHLLTDPRAEPAAEEARLLLFECVRELLLNAIKHSGVTEARVMLERTEDRRICLTVSDDGKGFDPAVLKNRSAAEASFGLFSIQERLAHIEGQIEIEAAPGRGAQIQLSVPTAEAPTAAQEFLEEARKEYREEGVRMACKQERCRVLIVDDHKIMREGLKRLLQFESDVEVVGEAADGPQAIELADRLKPDLIIMDVTLGDMNGVEATRRIHGRQPQIRIIGLSMHIDPDISRAMLDAGACAYLTKSGPMQELIEAMRACV